MTEEKSRLVKLDAENKFDTTRQRDIFDPHAHQGAHCTLVGCGGIGSLLGVLLSKLGIPSLTLIDFDTIEAVNIPNQMYPISTAGMPKTKVLQTLCTSFGAADVKVLDGKAQDHKRALRGCVVTGLDSLAARADVWKMVKNNIKVERLIDGRIGKEDIVVYSVNPCDKEDQALYEEFLGKDDDEDTEELACTERGIIDISAMVAGYMTKQVRQHFSGGETHRILIHDQANLNLIKAK